MRFLCFFILLSLLCSCGHLPKAKPWTKGEKILLLASILAAGADYYTTERCLDDERCFELNPGIGERPTDTQLFIKGWGGYAGLIAISHYSGKYRSGILGGLFMLNIGFAIYNTRLPCY